MALPVDLEDDAERFVEATPLVDHFFADFRDENFENVRSSLRDRSDSTEE
jgi:hypothetical protein